MAGHGFKVDDAKGLVDRGATEDAAITVKLDGLLLADHLLDPDNAWMVQARVGDLLYWLTGQGASPPLLQLNGYEVNGSNPAKLQLLQIVW